MRKNHLLVSDSLDSRYIVNMRGRSSYDKLYHLQEQLCVSCSRCNESSLAMLSY